MADSEHLGNKLLYRDAFAGDYAIQSIEGRLKPMPILSTEMHIDNAQNRASAAIAMILAATLELEKEGPCQDRREFAGVVTHRDLAGIITRQTEILSQLIDILVDTLKTEYSLPKNRTQDFHK